MIQTKKQLNQTKVNLAVDSGILVGFLVAYDPHLTGIAIHEWLGLAFGTAIIAHLLLHWQWMVEVTRRFLSTRAWQARLNYILNMLLFVDVTIIILSGLMISRVALPSLGVSLGTGGAWRGLHDLSSNLALLMIGLHLALHWQWIVSAIKRHVVQPLSSGWRSPEPHLGTNLNQKEV